MAVCKAKPLDPNRWGGTWHLRSQEEAPQVLPAAKAGEKGTLSLRTLPREFDGFEDAPWEAPFLSYKWGEASEVMFRPLLVYLGFFDF